MTAALLLLFVIGAMVLALVIDIAVVIGWLRRWWPR